MDTGVKLRCANAPISHKESKRHSRHTLKKKLKEKFLNLNQNQSSGLKIQTTSRQIFNEGFVIILQNRVTNT